MIKIFLKWAVGLCLIAASSLAWSAIDVDFNQSFAASTQTPFIFDLKREQDYQTLVIDIQPDHYLYEHKFRFEYEKLGHWLPVNSEQVELEGHLYPKEDISFGNVNVYMGALRIKLSHSAPKIRVVYQGCQDGMVCFPPSAIVIEGDSFYQDADFLTSQLEEKATQDLNETTLAKSLQTGNMLWLIGGFFIAGLLLSLTPCTLVLYPILMGILMRSSAQKNLKSRLYLTSLYIIGMMTVLLILGLFVFFLRAHLGAIFQSRTGTSITVLVLLFLAMVNLDWYRMPGLGSLQVFWHRLEDRLTGKFQFPPSIQAYLLGLFSGLLSSACISVPLFSIFLFLAQAEEAQLTNALMALVMLGLGMGVPLFLLAVGVSQIKRINPAWQQAVKRLISVLMLAMALYLARFLYPGWVKYFGWNTVLLGTFVIGVFILIDTKKNVGNWRSMKLHIISSGFLILLALYLTAGLNLRYWKQSVLPFEAYEARFNQWIDRSVSSYEDTIDAIESQVEPAVFFVSADWCLICGEIKHKMLADPVLKASLETLPFIEIDLTFMPSRENQLLLKELGIFGPPVFLFVKNGKIEPSLTLPGQINKKLLKKRVDLIQSE